MSNQPDQPQPDTGTPPGYTPPGYMAQPTPPHAFDQAQYGQNPYPETTYGAPQAGQFQPSQFAAPAYYKGGPGYVDSTSGPRALSLASMIIGLASLFLAGWFIVPQIVGIVLGHMGLSKESPQGRPFSITGLITNYLALLIYGAIYGFVIVGLAMMGFDSTDTSSTSDASWS